jgi:transposase
MLALSRSCDRIGRSLFAKRRQRALNSSSNGRLPGLLRSKSLQRCKGGRSRCTSPDRSTRAKNLAEVLKLRATELPPLIQMSDALSRNVPKLPAGVEMLLARRLAHGRRQFVEVAQNFPDQCRYVLETLGEVYGHDAEARERRLSPEKRLRFHQEHSQPSERRNPTPGWARRSSI